MTDEQVRTGVMTGSSMSTRTLAAVYIVLLLLALVALSGICRLGEAQSLVSAAAVEQSGRAYSTQADSFNTEKVSLVPVSLAAVLCALVTVMIASRLVGQVFIWLGQPRVIGEVVAGILLGPSLLGRVAPEVMDSLLPQSVMPVLGVLAQLGVVLYMFLVGLELNPEHLRHRAQTTVAISHGSIVLPFLLGAGLALWLFPRFAPVGISFTNFALFLGVAMSITAFPVLARILTDRGIEQTELGVVALSCAAADDVTAWCLLATVVGVAKANTVGALTTIGLAAAYLALMVIAVRPWLTHWLRSPGMQQITGTGTAIILISVFTSSLITEAIGIHAIFGAFLLGAMIPHDSPLVRLFRGRFEEVVSLLLLPMFFAYTGMNTQIGLLSTPTDWAWCAVIIVVATVGKFGGTLLTARSTGVDWRTASALGILMNTRGLMELIVLNIGLQLGIISPGLFAMMVLMALVTTMATTPLLNLVMPVNVKKPIASVQAG